MKELNVHFGRSNRNLIRGGYEDRTPQDLIDRGYITNWKPMGLGDYLIITSRLINFAKKRNVKVICHYLKVLGLHHNEELYDRWVDKKYFEYKLYSDIDEYYRELKKLEPIINEFGYGKLTVGNTIIPKEKYITYSLNRRWQDTEEKKNLLLNKYKDAGYKLIDIGDFQYTLPECIDLLSNCEYHITTENGLAHLAGCCGAKIKLYKIKPNNHNGFLENSCNTESYIFNKTN
jgi:hypothetical protein